MTNKGDGSYDQAEQLARLMRLSRDHELSDATRDAVKALLLNELLPTTAETPALAARAKEPAPAPAAKASVPAPEAFPRTAQQLELKLRQLVDGDQNFDQMEAPALELFAQKPSSETAARIVELAFLRGTDAEIEALIVRFKTQAKDFYRQMHAAVRAHLVARLWRGGSADALATLVFRDRDEAYLQPIERLFVFHSMRGAKDHATPYIYFRRYRRELLDAVQDLGAHVGVTLSQFLLLVGKMAAELGYDSDARELLEQIGPESTEQDEALRLLLDVAVEKNKAGRSHYSEMLLQQTEPKARLKLLSQFLSATRGLGGFRDKNRPALNDILRAPLEWITEEAENWATLSELLCANRDLDPLIPNLYEVFRLHALRFFGPVLDAALWQGPLGMHAETPRDRYFRGVALLHHYVNAGPSAEAALWEARALVADAKRDWRAPLPYSWKDLHKATFSWVSKNHYVLEADRIRMLEQLRVAVDTDVVALNDVEEYVLKADGSPAGVLRSLEDVAALKGAHTLAYRLILKQAMQSHLTNRDLDKLWTLANEKKDSDLAWRVATVSHARQALSAPVRHAWEISGEKRTRYTYQAPDKGMIEQCLRGFNARASRLAYASLHIGQVLPDLLALLDPGVATVRVAAPPADSVEAQVDKALAAVPWLKVSRRRFRFSFEGAGGTTIPAFMQVLPANPWSILVARLADRLGVNAWGWKLSYLHSQVIDLIPRLASRQDLRRHSGKVAKWLKDLTPEQRAAWQDLALLSRAMEDDKAQEALASFLCRLATVIYQNHYMALTSLQAMRAPVGVIWDLETFLLGESYGDVRAKLVSQNRVLVPNALKRLTTIKG